MGERQGEEQVRWGREARQQGTRASWRPPYPQGATATCEGSTATAAWAGRHGYRKKKRKELREEPPGTIFLNYKKVQQQFNEFKRGT